MSQLGQAGRCVQTNWTCYSKIESSMTTHRATEGTPYMTWSTTMITCDVIVDDEDDCKGWIFIVCILLGAIHRAAPAEKFFSPAYSIAQQGMFFPRLSNQNMDCSRWTCCCHPTAKILSPCLGFQGRSLPAAGVGRVAGASHSGAGQRFGVRHSRHWLLMADLKLGIGSSGRSQGQPCIRMLLLVSSRTDHPGACVACSALLAAAVVVVRSQESSGHDQCVLLTAPSQVPGNRDRPRQRERGQAKASSEPQGKLGKVD